MAELPEKQLQQFAQRLRTRREQLRALIHAELVNSQEQNYAELAGMVHDAGDDSFAKLLRGINLTTRVRELEEIQDIEASLERIKNGAYASCADCGDAITYERLDAYPTAKRCITCQSRRENRRGGRDPTPSL